MSEQIVVVDEGSAQAIAAWYDEKTKTINSHLIPSMIGMEVDTDPVGNPLDNSYEVDGEEYCVSPSLKSPVTTKRDTYQISVENRVLVHEVLRQAGFGGQSIEVMATLPITQYFVGSSHHRNDELIAQKKRNLLGDISNINQVPLAQIKNCLVAPESIPGFFDYAINDKGEWTYTLEPGQTAMVVDIGGTTTDMSIVSGVGSPQKRHSASVGVYDIAEALATEMISNGKAKTLPRAHLDAVLRTGQYRGFDCTDMIAKAAKRVVAEILNKMQEFESDPMALEKILFVGGGAALIGDTLAEKYGNPDHSVIPENPDLSVARGLVKMQLASALAQQAEASTTKKSKAKADTAEA